MRNCLKCNNKIPFSMVIDGKVRKFDKRKYCLDCSPFGSHNTRSLQNDDTRVVMKICKICEREYQGGHRQHKDKCGRCYSLAYRTKTKERAIEYKGGACSVCGYKKYIGSLHFHHVYPETKSFNIGEMYGVSDNAVNKWCKFYNITKPGRGDWEKIKSGKLDKPSD